MSLYNWGKTNKKNIENHIKNKNYKDLLNEYYIMSEMSKTQLAKTFHCSRRALGRYLSGERQVPFSIIKIILQNINLESEKANNNSNDDNMFIWYGEKDTLFNIMHAYRILHLKWSEFEAACNLDIPIDKISDYERGKRKIPITDLHKILKVYGLKINELFPALVSYDGNKTFLPLKPVMILQIDDKEYNLLEDPTPLYVSVKREELVLWPEFPIWRYDAEGNQLLNYMPEELTIDEYINTDELVFIKDDFSYYEYDYTEKKLPPVYKHILEKTNNVEYKRKAYERKIYGIKFLDNYKIRLYNVGGPINIFDLNEYVFSDSIWYSMLQNIEYFKQGELKYIGDQIYQNLCIIWPDGQYIRIIELYLDKYPKQHLTQKYCLRSNDIYENWTVYK